MTSRQPQIPIGGLNTKKINENKNKKEEIKSTKIT